MLRIFGILLSLWLVLGAEPSPAIAYPESFPEPQAQQDFAPTKESIALGRKLFHENALSVTNTVSCAFCHLPNEAFSDPSNHPWGVRPAQSTRRHSMPLFNLAWKEGPFRWDGDEDTLRGQILRPISDPIELGEDLTTLPAKLAKTGDYPSRFSLAFGDPEITSERLAVAIEHYLFSVISADSKFDRAEQGKAQLTKAELRGKELFFRPAGIKNGEKGAGCAQCHPAPLFTDHGFHNNGLSPRRRDAGREEVTGERGDRYQFSTPSLRNIEITAPYMHDARFATLAEVVEHYSSGLHKSATLAPSLAELRNNGLQLTDSDQAALVAFLKTLTDPLYEGEEETIEVDDPFAQ